MGGQPQDPRQAQAAAAGGTGYGPQRMIADPNTSRFVSSLLAGIAPHVIAALNMAGNVPATALPNAAGGTTVTAPAAALPPALSTPPAGGAPAAAINPATTATPVTGAPAAPAGSPSIPTIPISPVAAMVEAAGGNAGGGSTGNASEASGGPSVDIKSA